MKDKDLAGQRIAIAIREELARRRMSREQLAQTARISLSTLEKALKGSRPFTFTSLVRLETALGIVLRDTPEAAPSPVRSGAAPPELGAYTHDAVTWLEGDYITLRPSFGSAGAIYAYRTAIVWDADAACLTFHEANREDAHFAQKGVVSVPNKSGHIYLHTHTDGQFRLAILGRPLSSGAMYGLLTTLQSGPGTQLVPVSVPFALVPAGPEAETGRILPEAAAYPAYRAHLARILDDGFARLLAV